MDLHTIKRIDRPASRGELPAWRSGNAWLAGGTWLFSEPQPALDRLIDLQSLDWPPLEISPDGLRIGATCTLAQLAAAALPDEWLAAPLFRQCCRALLGSFKIWNAATVGGNLCMALPAGPMAALATALQGICTVWAPDGTDRRIEAAHFILGPQRTALKPDELLRSVELPADALRQRTAFRQISLTPAGRSGALLIGTAAPFALTVTAATRYPVHLRFTALPTATELRTALAHSIPDTLYYDDIHGAPDWRRAVTMRLAEDIREELA